MEHVSFLVFPITCKFFISTIKKLTKKYLNQMCNSNKFSFIIGVTRTCNFQKISPILIK